MNKSLFNEENVEDLDNLYNPLPTVFAYIVDVKSNDVIATVDRYSVITGEEIFSEQQFDMLATELLQIVARSAPERQFVLEVKKNGELNENDGQ